MNTVTTTGIDTSDMLLIHRVIRREIGLLPGLIRIARSRDRAARIAAHAGEMLDFLHTHHTGEDDGAFPKLAEQFPGLRPVLEELRRDHRLVEDSLQRLQALLDGLDQEMDPVVVRSELDSLAALMETHFVYEEKRIASALNALNAPGWDRSRPGFLLIDDTEH